MKNAVSRIHASSRLVFWFGALCLTVAHSPAQADDFYKGKTVSFIIGYNPGGTYDTYSRLIAAHLSRYLPGNPTIVPRNMPGVGGLKAAKFLFHQAPRDGSAIGMTSQAVALEQVLKNPAIDFDAAKFNWIGRMTSVVEVTVVWHTSPVKMIRDAMKHEVLLGATSARSTSNSLPRVLNSIAGTKFKTVLGYKGATGTMLAMERGEVAGGHTTAQILMISKRSWVEEKKISVLVQYSQVRHQTLPNVPTMVELGNTAEEKQILSLYGSTAEVGRSVVAPSGLLPERVTELRNAFDAMLKDQKLRAEMKKRRMEFSPLSGSALQELITEALKIAPGVAARAEKARK
jgi:tripartite-type tricarboxylate transporter receptor subunit TctC